MSMDTYVRGIKPADEKFKKMYSIYKQCEEMKIEIPKEVEEFFNDDYPDEKGVVVNIKQLECCKKYQDEGEVGFEIYVDKIPKDIKIIRFVNSW